MATIPESFRDLFDRKVFAALATVMPSGQPQVTPVWVSLEGDQVWVNTARGRQKDRNLHRDGRATLCLFDPDNPYRWIEVRGRVVEETEEGGVDHINALSNKYNGQPDYYANQPGLRQRETRVIYKIQPEHVTHSR